MLATTSSDTPSINLPAPLTLAHSPYLPASLTRALRRQLGSGRQNSSEELIRRLVDTFAREDSGNSVNGAPPASHTHGVMRQRRDQGISIPAPEVQSADPWATGALQTLLLPGTTQIFSSATRSKPVHAGYPEAEGTHSHVINEKKTSPQREQSMLPTWKCSICLERKEQADVSTKGLCWQAKCKAVICHPCQSEYLVSMVNASRFMVLPIRCPGCLDQVPVPKWEKLVPDSCAQAYTQGAKDMLNYRCPECHTTRTLFLEGLDISTEVYSLRRSKIQKRVGDALQEFENGNNHANDLVQVIADVADTADLFSRGGPHEFLLHVLSVISDVERRCTLHLACLNLYPKIFTQCCGARLCFRCKIRGHHFGQTCQEIQENELGVQVQYCPGCNVATQKTEGCSHMVCLCGRHWTWIGRDLGLVDETEVNVERLLDLGFDWLDEEVARAALASNDNDFEETSTFLTNLNQLIEEGHDEDDSRAALAVSENDVDDASNLLNRNDRAELDVGRLMLMGFAMNDVRSALGEAGGDFDQTVDALMDAAADSD